MKTLWFTGLLIAFALAGCHRTIECTGPNIQLAFKGYTRNAVDTFVLRKYQKNDLYQHLVDTTIVTTAIPVFITTDTAIQVLVSHYTGLQILPGFDWEIFVPASNKRYRISDIDAEDNKTGRCPIYTDVCRCTNQLHSLRVDGQIFIPRNEYSSENHFIPLPL